MRSSFLLERDGRVICQPRTLLAVVLVCLASASGLTQEAPTAGNKPKIGLVLEGGGALGLAHIGVIEWLEEHRIPVSYIAGTSMGGLVGGVYAHRPQPSGGA